MPIMRAVSLLFALGQRRGYYPQLLLSLITKTSNDSFAVYDGENGQCATFRVVSVAQRYSSTVLVATSGTMFIAHITDGSTVGRGVAATWSISSNSCSTETFNMADNFPSASYSASSGSTPWSSDWLEAGESDGPSSGYLRVNNSLCSGGNCLRLGVISSENPRSYGARFRL